MFTLSCLSLSLYLNFRPNLNSWHHGLSKNVWSEGSLRSDGSVTAYQWTQEKLARGDGREGTGIKGSIRGPCRSKKALKGGLDKQLYVSKKFIRKHWQFPIPTMLPILTKRPRKLFLTNAVRAICCFSGIIRTYISVNLRWPLMFFSSTTSCASEYLSEKVVMQHQPPPLWARWPKTLLSEVSN